MSGALMESQPLRNQLLSHYAATETWPATLDEIGFSGTLNPATVSDAYIDEDGDLVVVLGSSAGPAAGKMFYFTPYLDDNDKIQMSCGKINVEPKHLPTMCR